LNEEADFVVVGMAASGAKIVKLAEKVAFDIILMDVEMESAGPALKPPRKS
jgi:AmiR/NasT family two-component response regulator